MSIKILGLDPGFAKLGWAQMVLHEEGEDDIVGMGLIETHKSTKKSRVLASDDEFRRSREITEALLPLFEGVTLVVSEGASWPRHAYSSRVIGRAWGIVSALVTIRGLPFLDASPQFIKKSLCNRKSASKEGVMTALDALYAGKPAALLEDVAPSKRDHPYDALGAIVVCKDSNEVRMARAVARKQV